MTALVTRCLLTIVILALTSVGSAGCGGDADAALGGVGGGERRPVAVRIEPVQLRSLTRSLERTGTLLTDQDVEVATQFGGRLIYVGVQVGDEVHAGQLMAAMDDREVKRTRQEAAAGLDLADATLRQARLDAERADRDLARIETLAADQLVTTQQLDDARSAAAGAQAGLDSAVAQMEQARARLESLLLQEAETRLVAPFDGQVADRYHEAGDTVPAGAAVIRLVGRGPLRARIQVPAYAAVQLEPGTPVVIDVDAYPAEHFTGVIAGVSPAVDPESGTVVVEATVEDDSGRLMPGMFARLTVDLPQVADALMVPAEAVIDHPEGQGDAVFLVHESTATLRPVVLGTTHQGQTEVLEGLVTSDAVVVGGQHLLKDGVKVEILGGSMPEAETVSVPEAEAEVVTESETTP
jgi:RND family efflux transporter MFP subunit